MKTLKSLTPNQIRAAALMVEGLSGVAIAGALGIRAETVSRWKRAPAFAAEVRRLVDTAQNGTPRERTAALLPRAFDALQDALDDSRPVALSLRVSAAAALLNFAAALGERGP